jgi:uncharacterized protein
MRQLALKALVLVEGWLVGVLLLLVRGYQFMVSPALSPRCRFLPTCSDYAAESLKRHGLVKGLWRSAWRLARCHPLAKSGYDPP